MNFLATIIFHITMVWSIMTFTLAAEAINSYFWIVLVIANIAAFIVTTSLNNKLKQ
jgi:uncharacterized membrane protein